MYNTTEQLAGLNQAHVAQTSKLAALALDSAERVTHLALQAAKATLAQGVETVQAAAAAKDVRELFALRANLAESSVEVALGYSKNLYAIATAAKAQYAALAEESWAVYTKGVAAWVDAAGKSAPAGSEAAVNAFKSTFAASTAAIDQINQLSKQIANLTDASLRSAADNAPKVAAATKGRKAA